MKKYRGIIIIAALFILILPAVASASDISNALWSATLRVTNSGEETSNVATVFSANTAAMIENGFLNSDADDVVIRYGADDVPFMPGYDDNPWPVFVESENGEESNFDYDFYSGNATGGKIRYFPSASGMSVSDNANLELGSDGSVEVKAYIDTTAGASKDIFSHSDGTSGGIKCLISPSLSENIAARIYLAEDNLSNSSSDTTQDHIAGINYSRIAQKVTIDNEWDLNEVSFYLSKSGSPTGNGYARVRRVSDDSLMGTIESINVATISGYPTYTDYAFDDNPITDISAGDYYICFEYGGGDGANFLNTRYQASNVIDGCYAYYWAGWTDESSYDLRFSMDWIEYLEASASGISSGEHKLEVYVDTLNFTIEIDDVVEDTVALSGASVPDSSAAWTFCEAAATPYVEYAEINVGGVQKGYWEWGYASTFTDQSGNGNDATPTFRTSSSDADVSAELLDWQPTEEAKVDSFTLISSYEILTGNLTIPVGMFSDSDFSKLPAAPINEILDESEVPRAAWWLPFIFLAICITGMIAYGATTMTRGQNSRIVEGQLDGSLIFMVVIIQVLLVVMGMMGPIPYWPAYLFPIAGVAIILSKKHFSWG